MCLNYTCNCKNSEWASHPKTCCGLAQCPGNEQVDASGCWSPFPKGLTWSFSFAKIRGYVFVVPVPGSSSGFSPWPLDELDQKLLSAAARWKLQHSFNFSHVSCPSEIRGVLGSKLAHKDFKLRAASRKLSRVWTAHRFSLHGAENKCHIVFGFHPEELTIPGTSTGRVGAVVLLCWSFMEH